MLLIDVILNTCLCVLTVHALASAKTYVARRRLKLPSTIVTDELHAASKCECAVRCRATRHCLSVSWSHTLRQCLLSEKDMAWEWALGGGKQLALFPDSQLIQDHTWTTYGQIRYPVAYFHNSDYKFSFRYARIVCMGNGFELATEKQVLDARAMGLDWCGCGWFENGTVGFVLTSPLKICTDQFDIEYDTGILYCEKQDAHGVWCTMH